MFDNTKTKYLASVTDTDFPQPQLISINCVLVTRTNHAPYSGDVLSLIPVHRNTFTYLQEVQRILYLFFEGPHHFVVIKILRQVHPR